MGDCQSNHHHDGNTFGGIKRRVERIASGIANT
jgi:hypothetical protein